MGGFQLRDEVHYIDLYDNLVQRDGRPVKIVLYKDSRGLKVGCTYITRAAVDKLVALTKAEECGVVIQEGYD